MNKSLVLKNKLYLFFSLVFSFLLFLYLLNVLINAPRGIISYNKIKDQKIYYESKLKNLKNKNDFFIDRTSRLQVNTIDIDFLDELLRKKKGLTLENELIISLNE